MRDGFTKRHTRMLRMVLRVSGTVAMWTHSNEKPARISVVRVPSVIRGHDVVAEAAFELHRSDFSNMLPASVPKRCLRHRHAILVQGTQWSFLQLFATAAVT